MDVKYFFMDVKWMLNRVIEGYNLSNVKARTITR